MAAKPGSTLILRIGNQSRSFQWDASSIGGLSRLLGKDYFQYALNEGSFEVFISNALFVGLGMKARREKISPDRIMKWLNEEVYDNAGNLLSDDDLMKEVLYAIARGKRASEAKKQIELLDQIYNDHPEDAEEPGPLDDVSLEITNPNMD